MIISDTYTQAAEFINALKDEFENNPKIKWLFGNMRGDDWQDGEFVLSNGIKYAAKGSGMKIRGIRHRHTRTTKTLRVLNSDRSCITGSLKQLFQH